MQSIFCSNAQFGVTNPGIFFLTNRLGGAADHQPVCRDRPLNQFPIKNSTVLRHGIEQSARTSYHCRHSDGRTVPESSIGRFRQAKDSDEIFHLCGFNAPLDVLETFGATDAWCVVTCTTIKPSIFSVSENHNSEALCRGQGNEDFPHWRRNKEVSHDRRSCFA